eukprot:364942-Chlamydomonas_euryale.AAC.19
MLGWCNPKDNFGRATCRRTNPNVTGTRHLLVRLDARFANAELRGVDALPRLCSVATHLHGKSGNETVTERFGVRAPSSKK